MRHRQLITTINVIRNLLPVTCYISPAIIYILFRQLLQEAEFCHIPFFCLSISEYRICNSIFISYSIRHYSAYLCLFISGFQNACCHLRGFYPVIHHQLSAINGHMCHLKLSGGQGDTLLSISPLYHAYPVHIYR